MPKFETLKVFDCHGMPEDIMDLFFKEANDPESHGNDCYVDWYIDHPSDPHSSEDKRKVDAWLVENGAGAAPDEKSSGETVLIKHWW